MQKEQRIFMNKYNCIISQTPIHNGDGYSYGGDVIITIETDRHNLNCSLNLGSLTMGNERIMELAHIIQAALHNYHETPDKVR